jgi:hypothetical protein
MTLTAILISILGGVVVAYLPGAVIFRLPIADRNARAALAAEERVFWQIVISIIWSLGAVMIMAAAGVYRYERLLALNVGVVDRSVTGRAGRAALARDAGESDDRGARAADAVRTRRLAVLSSGRIRDRRQGSGVYVNEGIAIARTGQLFRRDAVVPAVPQADRDLFFRSHQSVFYYGLRFMGVNIRNPDTAKS